MSIALAPIFAPPKGEKRLERAENATERLAMQANSSVVAVWTYIDYRLPDGYR